MQNKALARRIGRKPAGKGARPVGCRHQCHERLPNDPRPGDQLPGRSERPDDGRELGIGSFQHLRPVDEIETAPPLRCIRQQTPQRRAPSLKGVARQRFCPRRKDQKGHGQPRKRADNRLFQPQDQHLRRKTTHETVDQRQHDRHEKRHRRIRDRQQVEGEKDADGGKAENDRCHRLQQTGGYQTHGDPEQRPDRPLHRAHRRIPARARIGKDEERRQHRPEPALPREHQPENHSKRRGERNLDRCAHSGIGQREARTLLPARSTRISRLRLPRNIRRRHKPLYRNSEAPPDGIQRQAGIDRLLQIDVIRCPARGATGQPLHSLRRSPAQGGNQPRRWKSLPRENDKAFGGDMQFEKADRHGDPARIIPLRIVSAICFRPRRHEAFCHQHRILQPLHLPVHLPPVAVVDPARRRRDLGEDAIDSRFHCRNGPAEIDAPVIRQNEAAHTLPDQKRRQWAECRGRQLHEVGP